MSEFRLVWKKRVLGTVSNVSGSFPWMEGAFRPGRLDRSLRGFFEWCVDENAGEPDFDEELLDEENWWLVSEEGGRQGIAVPAVHLEDNSISWRWR